MSKEEEFAFTTKVIPLRDPHISWLNECLILEIKLNGKSMILSTLYRSRSQSTDEFENFLSEFEDKLFSIISQKPVLTCILGNINPSYLDGV